MLGTQARVDKFCALQIASANSLAVCRGRPLAIAILSPACCATELELDGSFFSASLFGAFSLSLRASTFRRRAAAALSPLAVAKCAFVRLFAPDRQAAREAAGRCVTTLGVSNFLLIHRRAWRLNAPAKTASQAAGRLAARLADFRARQFSLSPTSLREQASARARDSINLSSPSWQTDGGEIYLGEKREMKMEKKKKKQTSLEMLARVKLKLGAANSSLSRRRRRFVI